MSVRSVMVLSVMIGVIWCDDMRVFKGEEYIWVSCY